MFKYCLIGPLLCSFFRCCKQRQRQCNTSFLIDRSIEWSRLPFNQIYIKHNFQRKQFTFISINWLTLSALNSRAKTTTFVSSSAGCCNIQCTVNQSCCCCCDCRSCLISGGVFHSSFISRSIADDRCPIDLHKWIGKVSLSRSVPFK